MIVVIMRRTAAVRMTTIEPRIGGVKRMMTVVTTLERDTVIVTETESATETE